MSVQPIAILHSGMVTPVGLTAPASCAAIRCAIDNFSETRFVDEGGEWIIGGQVPLEEPWRGLPRLLHMVVPAIRECLAPLGRPRTEQMPLLLCLAEKDRPGRLEGLDERLLPEAQTALGMRFHPRSAVIPHGRVAGALALIEARKLIHEERLPFCLIAGADCYLLAGTLAAYEEKGRLLTSQNSNGFIPGEAGAAVLVGPISAAGAPFAVPALGCLGIGRGSESATVESDQPLRGDGLAAAFKAAFAEAGVDYGGLDFRITDANGEQYWFKEAALALSRTMRVRKEQFDIWHPVDCIGETGAAAGPCIFGVALAALRKGYALGPGILAHFGADDGQRLALVLRPAERKAA